MTRLRWVLLVLLAGIALGAPACRPSPAATDGATVELRDYPLGGDFTLTSHEGKPFRLADVGGKVAFLFFGYVSCPDICPLSMSKIADAVKRVPEARDQIAVLFVTVDVDRDTPEALARYVKAFDAPMVGLTGTRAEVDAVVAAYKAYYEITPSTSAAGPEVGHTGYIYVMNRAGKVRALLSHDDRPEDMASVLRLALRE